MLANLANPSICYEQEKDPKIQMRFGGSSNTNEGYVEVNVKIGTSTSSAQWQGFKGVCDDGFDLNDAHVICRMAGYPDGASAFFTNSKPFGRPRGSSGRKFAVSNLHCMGTETRITECQLQFMNLGCSYGDWAGVRCKGEKLPDCLPN